jgi:DNA-directed RNA polymerase specialized sigma24 family protein
MTNGPEELYEAHRQSLIKLAALLVRDEDAEEVVRDCLPALRTAWPRLRDNDKAESYLRQCVVNRSRSVLRHRLSARRMPDS